MTTNEFKEYVKTRQALDTEEIHRFMDRFYGQDASGNTPGNFPKAGLMRVRHLNKPCSGSCTKRLALNRKTLRFWPQAATG